MFFRSKSLFTLAVLSLAGVAHADNCEPIRAKIEAQIRDAGVAVFTVTVMPQDAPASGEAVGSCDNGQQKIVYNRGVAAVEAPAAAKPASPPPRAAGAPAHARNRDPDRVQGWFGVSRRELSAGGALMA